ncbi:hypothetical protein [Bradyrhizobium sp. Ec3.3]|uniref:hypothetical protein n=1 Tax=Bradyrhizobium sp. Ec3.3 TaxID=189753 RepID=UPI0004131B05|nr:hypothetical protein [Bradyrhizobium sp. Ec3.3]
MGAFIDECLAGVDGPSNRNFNTRWIGSLVAEAYRIPRPLRCVHLSFRRAARPRRVPTYEADSIPFMMEQAGGGPASTGRERILDLARIICTSP